RGARARSRQGRQLTTPDLVADAVVKRFADHVAVDSLSFTVDRGSFFSILGPSGCGKTTLLRLIAGFIAPDAGEIAVGGKRLSAPGNVVPPERRGMSMIFQSYALWPHMTVEQNVGYGLRVRTLPAAEIARRVGTICAATRLE